MKKASSLRSNISEHPLLLSIPSRFALSAENMEQQDYDCRTALHIAAAEGDSLSSTHTFLTFSLSFDSQTKINEISN